MGRGITCPCSIGLGVRVAYKLPSGDSSAESRLKMDLKPSDLEIIMTSGASMQLIFGGENQL